MNPPLLKLLAKALQHGRPGFRCRTPERFVSLEPKEAALCMWRHDQLVTQGKMECQLLIGCPESM
jgi:hypothetical protein